MSNPVSEFPGRLKIAMTERRMSAAELARIHGDTTARNVYRWRAADSEPPVSAIPRLCLALGVSADWLTGTTNRGGPRRPRVSRYAGPDASPPSITGARP